MFLQNCKYEDIKTIWTNLITFLGYINSILLKTDIEQNLGNWSQGQRVFIAWEGGTAQGQIARINIGGITLYNVVVNNMAMETLNIRMAKIIAIGISAPEPEPEPEIEKTPMWKRL
ncbi:hypothetical protein DEAC_c36000 [Desulfosporosinus acididurans]|uniref:Uncharacterized protein n=2 Tax=Desulfosporosinus acididurans TaxID=476652 RepID=A0A0J1FN61_9FIRM|nr:hypothetical protein DEAC_c36000 [Desulfosporosinus acididurans]